MPLPGVFASEKLQKITMKNFYESIGGASFNQDLLSSLTVYFNIFEDLLSGLKNNGLSGDFNIFEDLLSVY